ncbi:hypothetical protein D3C79_946980 [compost metagenome]
MGGDNSKCEKKGKAGQEKQEASRYRTRRYLEISKSSVETSLPECADRFLRGELTPLWGHSHQYEPGCP